MKSLTQVPVPTKERKECTMAGWKDEYDKAIEDRTESIRDAYHDRASAYEKRGQYSKAIKDYTEVIRLKPDDERAYFNRGTAYDMEGEYLKAIEDYSEAIRLKPDFTEAYASRGEAHRSQSEADHDTARSLHK